MSSFNKFREPSSSTSQKFYQPKTPQQNEDNMSEFQKMQQLVKSKNSKLSLLDDKSVAQKKLAEEEQVRLKELEAVKASMNHVDTRESEFGYDEETLKILREQKEEEELRKQKEEEELRKQKEEEELRKQKEEEEIRKQKEEEELRKQKEEDELRKQKEEEKLRKQKEEEELRKQKEEEELRKQKEENEDRKQKEEEEFTKQKEDDELRKQKEEEEHRKQKEEEELRKQKEEEELRKQKEEEELRKQKEEEELRKQKEEEKLRKQKEEEELRKQKEEDDVKEVTNNDIVEASSSKEAANLKSNPPSDTDPLSYLSDLGKHQPTSAKQFIAMNLDSPDVDETNLIQETSKMLALELDKANKRKLQFIRTPSTKSPIEIERLREKAFKKEKAKLQRGFNSFEDAYIPASRTKRKRSLTERESSSSKISPIKLYPAYRRRAVSQDNASRVSSIRTRSLSTNDARPSIQPIIDGLLPDYFYTQYLSGLSYHSVECNLDNIEVDDSAPTTGHKYWMQIRQRTHERRKEYCRDEHLDDLVSGVCAGFKVFNVLDFEVLLTALLLPCSLELLVF